MTKEIRTESSFLGPDKDVIYEDGVKVGEIRHEIDDHILGFSSEKVDRTYDANGNLVAETRNEQETSLGAFYIENVSKTTDPSGKVVSETRLRDDDSSPFALGREEVINQGENVYDRIGSIRSIDDLSGKYRVIDDKPGHDVDPLTRTDRQKIEKNSEDSGPGYTSDYGDGSYSSTSSGSLEGKVETGSHPIRRGGSDGIGLDIAMVGLGILFSILPDEKDLLRILVAFGCIYGSVTGGLYTYGLVEDYSRREIKKVEMEIDETKDMIRDLNVRIREIRDGDSESDYPSLYAKEIADFRKKQDSIRVQQERAVEEFRNKLGQLYPKSDAWYGSSLSNEEIEKLRVGLRRRDSLKVEEARKKSDAWYGSSLSDEEIRKFKEGLKARRYTIPTY